jgi:hypothetical protein
MSGFAVSVCSESALSRVVAWVLGLFAFCLFGGAFFALGGCGVWVGVFRGDGGVRGGEFAVLGLFGGSKSAHMFSRRQLVGRFGAGARVCGAGVFFPGDSLLGFVFAAAGGG